ncbi:MAG: alginate export family protein [Methylotenera sp.]|nr:alginate export family protein [Methylotenera sp.]MDO9233144.1 alginate export family protein [Methylotenera sp.]MDP2402329.1 alginate export family protein [Methylotenera sp.]MDP3095708.1 alginate export family protein [Methylotenera sp.]MDZ4222743.1 alginate export family protein [Methylotenera sp.]
MKYKTIINALIATGLVASSNSILANEANIQNGTVFIDDKNGQSIQIADAYEVVPVNQDAQDQETKIKERLNEIVLEEKLAKRATNGYYVERKSYGTGRETDPPRYVKQLNKTWLKDVAGLENVNWLDIGLDYRFRYETRDNDFRRGRDTIDEPILLRTRGYVAVKDILDPLRFTLEVEDARRNHSQFSREFDTRDVNYAEPIQAYLELFFKETPLGKDDLGNNRPISIKAGRQAFEYTDRRLLARNEWRNTTNNFQGVRTTIGQSKNDWQLDLLALKPVQRLNNQLDEVDHSQDFYGVIGDWRRWSEYVTLQPYYYLLKQDGNKVEYDANGKTAAANTKIDREIHTAGIRAYGVIGATGWDYDASYVKQWGNQDRIASGNTFKLDHDAYSYNAEIGYSWKHAWKPRLSAFYGVASGDKNATDAKNQRFERLFGFARPWSNNDYFQMENISAPKVRAEFEPQLSWLPGLKVDAGYSWYRLDQERDRWNGAGLRDNRGQSGKDVGEEVDVRVRFPINKYIGVNVGYAHFWAGDFTKDTTAITGTGGTNQADPNRRDHSNFFYTEISISAF